MTEKTSKIQKNLPIATKEYTDFINSLAKIANDKDLQEINFQQNDVHIVIKRAIQEQLNTPTQFFPIPNYPPLQNSITSTPNTQPITEPTAIETHSNHDFSAHPGAVKSPMVGVLYTSSTPGDPPYVKVGDEVTENTTLFLIEAMKVFNPIKAHRKGKITYISVKNGDTVEYGDVLVVIE